ncbi:hypothetical protein DDK22_07305 [Cupriavidus necator]|uniref:Uncharacterized protein n=1 Tax=Cupriavidus necator TaxID=106590 RepID=A0A367PMA7_CUPNE|nr:hypothetical protein DDK22_07305 [Cupriavidus necator]
MVSISWLQMPSPEAPWSAAESGCDEARPGFSQPGCADVRFERGLAVFNLTDSLPWGVPEVPLEADALIEKRPATLEQLRRVICHAAKEFRSWQRKRWRVLKFCFLDGGGHDVVEPFGQPKSCSLR